MGRAARCGLADGADGEGRSDGDGEGVISGVGIAAGKRRGAVRKKNNGEGRNIVETLFLPLESFVEPRFNQKLSDLWALCERVGVNFLVGDYHYYRTGLWSKLFVPAIFGPGTKECFNRGPNG